MQKKLYQVDYYEGGAWHNYLCVGGYDRDVEQREYLSFLAEGRRIPKSLFKLTNISEVDGYHIKLISPREWAKEVAKKTLRQRKWREKKKLEAEEAEKAKAAKAAEKASKKKKKDEKGESNT